MSSAPLHHGRGQEVGAVVVLGVVRVVEAWANVVVLGMVTLVSQWPLSMSNDDREGDVGRDRVPR